MFNFSFVHFVCLLLQHFLDTGSCILHCSEVLARFLARDRCVGMDMSGRGGEVGLWHETTKSLKFILQARGNHGRILSTGW